MERWKELEASGSGGSLGEVFEWLRRSEKLRIAGVWALDAAAAGVLAGGLVWAKLAPLGVAYTAAVACGRPAERLPVRAGRLSALAAGIGACAGSFVFSPADPLRCAAACVIVLSAGAIFYGSALAGKRWYAPAAAAFALLGTGLAFAVTGREDTAWALFLRIAACLAEAGAGAGAAWLYDVFRQSLPPWSEGHILTRRVGGTLGRWELLRVEQGPDTAQRAALLGASATLCMALRAAAPLFGIRLGHVLAMLVILASAGTGALQGAAAGLLLGGALDLGEGQLLYAAVYGFAGLAAGLGKRRSALPTALAFVAVNGAAALWRGQMPALFEGFAASVVFWLFSGKFAALGALLFPETAPRAAVSQTREEPWLRTRVDELAAAFEGLSRMVSEETEPDEARAFSMAPFHTAVERTCRSCTLRDVCWDREYSGTRTALGDASQGVFRRGRAAAEDFPPYFAARCIRLQDFLANLNEALACMSYRTRFRSRIREDTRLLCAQYDGMTRVLGELMDEGREAGTLCPKESEALTAALHAAGIPVRAVEVRLHPEKGEKGRFTARIGLAAAGTAGAWGRGEPDRPADASAEAFPDKSADASAETSAGQSGNVSADASGGLSAGSPAGASLRESSDDPAEEAGVSFDAVAAAASKALGRAMIASPSADAGGVLQLREQEPLRVVVGVGMKARNGEAKSGDTGTWFKTPDGRVCLLISDGMGSGEEAARQSGTLARLLENFLRAGIRPRTALQLVCPAFAIRTDGETFASVDLLCIDLYTGAAEFYKCGAAPSFVWEEGCRVRRVASAALPAGLFAPGAPEADRTALRLQDGDAVVMVSDGVVGGPEEEQALVRQLAGLAGAGTGAGQLASVLLDDCAAGLDDATVLVCRISKR